MEPVRTKPKPGNRLLRSNTTSQSPDRKVTIGPKATVTTPGPEQAGSPTIEVKRGDHGIESIEVVCGCGERILIRCEYDE